MDMDFQRGSQVIFWQRLGTAVSTRWIRNWHSNFDEFDEVNLQIRLGVNKETKFFNKWQTV